MVLQGKSVDYQRYWSLSSGQDQYLYQISG